MAVVLVEGFDTYNGVTTSAPAIVLSAGWNVLSTASLSLVNGRFGGQAVSINTTSSGGINRNIGASTANFTVGFALYVPTLPTLLSTDLDCFLIIKSGSTFMMGLRLINTGALYVQRMATTVASGTALGNTSAGVITAATWNYIEFSCSISDTVGTVELKVNGQSVLSLANQDTRNGTPTTVDTIQLGNLSGSRGGTHYIDDLYFLDTTTSIGEQRVEVLYPNSDTAQKQWIASTGSDNYAMIDETLMTSTDYVYSNTVGNFDLYDFGNLSTTPSSISAVTIEVAAQKDNVGARAITSTVKSGSSTTDGSNVYLSTGFSVSSRLLNTDPNTSSAWTASAVNAIQAGAKVTI